MAATIDGPLRDLFLENFEQGMEQFRAERDKDSTALLREMAAYFVEFVPGPANYYRGLLRAIRDSRRKTVIVTTNYDVLLEQAISSAGLHIAYTAANAPKDNVAVLKIHGSCHFLPYIGANTMRGCTFVGSGTNFEGPIKIAQSAEEVRHFCQTEDSLAPAVALYAPGKRVLFCPSFVLKQQAEWKSAASAARTIYVIGLRVLPADDHIWGELAKAPGTIEYVGFEPDEFKAWSESHRRRRDHILERTLEAALPLISIQLRH